MVELQRSTWSTDKFASAIGTAIVEFTTTVATEGAFETADHGNAVGRKRRFTPFAGLTHLKHRAFLPDSVTLDHQSIRCWDIRQRSDLCLMSFS